ncbi:guanylate cyclase 32E [Trichonephila clavata]|uniref:Guanylate cyclase 32E n=1 Tax=Trichonephila clavata TaxID=2740835 RepID=A0A8X6L8Y1_TRICU|nr:guanylate cyclase 32E [Trichonephila clavata]
MATTFVVASLFVILVGGELQPHRTVVDLRRMNATFGKHTIDPYKPNITVGFLSSFKELGKLICGAISLAVDMVNADTGLLPKHNLKFIAYDSGEPNTAITIKKMTQMKEEGVVAFIGPDHSCVSEALVAAAWNMPMITYKCSDSKVSEKMIFPTFARTLPPSSKVSKSLISLLKHFTWDQLVLLVSDNPSEKQIAEALIHLAHKNDIAILETFYLPGDYLTKDNTTLKEIVMQTYKRTRVYVLIADAYSLVDFVRFMNVQGLLEGGEYVVIALEKEETYNPDKEYQFIRREFEAAWLVADPVPFRSVLLVCPGAPIHPDYSLFQDLVVNYSVSEPFNIPSHPVIKVEVPIYAGLVYDAVMIYASALTQALDDNISEHNGSAVFQYIKSRPYESILGFSVMIDDQGDAEGNYTVMALVQDDDEPPFQRMKPVARFNYQGSNGLPLLRLERPINWISGAPPRSEPQCGFTGEKCDTKPEWKMISIYIVCCVISIVAGMFIFRHYRYEQKLACLLWKVEMKDLILLRSDHGGSFQKFRNNLYVSTLF